MLLTIQPLERENGFHAVQTFENQSQGLSFIIVVRKVGIEYQ